jgi:hypothetical protein
MNCEEPIRKITGAIVTGFLFEHSDTVRLPVQGNSMHPLLQDGQMVPITMVDNAAPLRCGDIYAFAWDNRLVIHRFVIMKKDRAVFAGDNRPFHEVVDRSDVVGRYGIRHSALVQLVITTINVLFLSLPVLRNMSFLLKKVVLNLSEARYEKKV